MIDMKDPGQRVFAWRKAFNHVLDLCKKTILACCIFSFLYYTHGHLAWPSRKHDNVDTHGIEWYSCNDSALSSRVRVTLNGQLHILRSILGSVHKDDSVMQCTRINVPMTYESGDLRTISIPLAKRPANTTNTSGPPIFLNPGGPGGSGVGWALSTHFDQEFEVFHGTRDLISFDPRGINGSIPAMSCFADSPARTRWHAESGGLLSSAADSVARLWASNKVMGRQCALNAAEIGPYVSTWYVAHDMRYLAAKIMGESWESVKLDYWGFSYGTALGMTYGILFPDNMRRFVIDGVVDLYDYYAGSWADIFASTSHVVQHFYDTCAAHPENCPLAVNANLTDSVIPLTNAPDLIQTGHGSSKETRSAAEIEALVTQLLEALKDQPLAGNSVGLVTYSSVKSYIVETLYKPASWPTLATFLNDTLYGNTTVHREGRPTLDEGGLATACGDSHLVRPAQDKAYVSHTFTELLSRNAFFADWWTARVATRCQYYPFSSKTFFDNSSSSSFSSSLSSSVRSTLSSSVRSALSSSSSVQSSSAKSASSPSAWSKQEILALRGQQQRDGSKMLFASLEYDLVTPLINARAMHQEFSGSHLVVVKDGYGHCTLAAKSTCAAIIIAQWMNHGTTEANVMECRVDAGHGAFEESSMNVQFSPTPF